MCFFRSPLYWKKYPENLSESSGRTVDCIPGRILGYHHKLLNKFPDKKLRANSKELFDEFSKELPNELQKRFWRNSHKNFIRKLLKHSFPICGSRPPREVTGLHPGIREGQSNIFSVTNNKWENF